MAYRFDPDVIDQIAPEHLGKPMAEIAEAIGRDLKMKYPRLVDVNQPLVFNSLLTPSTSDRGGDWCEFICL